MLNCRKNIIVMRDALDRADFETVRSLGHQMSGTGALFGFRFISDTGVAIEQAAESSNVEASRDWVEKLSNYLDGIDTMDATTGKLPACRATGRSRIPRSFSTSIHNRDRDHRAPRCEPDVRPRPCQRTEDRKG